MSTPPRPADRLPVEHAVLAFRAWRTAPDIMPRAHAHADLEFNLPLGGALRYFFAGRFLDVPDGHFALFWAGAPHRLIARDPGTQYLCMTLPLATFLEWRVGGDLTGRLLGGSLLARPASVLENELFARWASDFVAGEADNAARQRIALLEVEACLRRIATESPGKATASPAAHAVSGTQAQRLAAHVSERFREPDLSAGRIADAVGLHPKYALALFHDACGMTLWEYVTSLRIAHARRLLLTTDWTVERIGLESGFASPGRFFAAFRARTDGVTPRRYRLLHG